MGHLHHRRILSITALALLLIGVAVAAAAALTHVKAKAAYDEAIRLEQSGDSFGAYERFRALGTHADAASRADALVEADPALPYREAHKGDIISFGAFEQDGEDANGPEDIEWIVLDRIDDELLLLSLDCLASRPYHALPFEPITWEHSDLRAWMNTEFLTGAFTPAQQGIIVIVTNENAEQSIAGTPAGPATRDRVFALSETETTVYIRDAIDRELVAKAGLSAAEEAGAVRIDDSRTVDWWLRSPGTYEFTAQFMTADGERFTTGANVDAEYGVRPALWITLDAPTREQ